VPVISAPVRHEFEASLDTQRNFVLKKKIKNHNKDTNKMHKKMEQQNIPTLTLALSERKQKEGKIFRNFYHKLTLTLIFHSSKL
jgi:hypothetical protein